MSSVDVFLIEGRNIGTRAIMVVKFLRKKSTYVANTDFFSGLIN